MNSDEVMAMIAKIIDADKVIHVQQLGIPWQPPSNYKFGDAKTGSGSGMNQNTSIADSSKHGASKFEGDEKSNFTGANIEGKMNIKKIRNVFKLLISELPFLIDKKVLASCEGKTPKEIFTIKIDAIRTALEIGDMEGVELLVQTFYDWSA